MRGVQISYEKGIWNSLPEDIVSADHLSLFVRLLNRFNLSQFLVGKG